MYIYISYNLKKRDILRLFKMRTKYHTFYIYSKPNIITSEGGARDITSGSIILLSLRDAHYRLQ